MLRPARGGRRRGFHQGARAMPQGQGERARARTTATKTNRTLLHQSLSKRPKTKTSHFFGGEELMKIKNRKI